MECLELNVPAEYFLSAEGLAIYEEDVFDATGCHVKILVGLIDVVVIDSPVNDMHHLADFTTVFIGIELKQSHVTNTPVQSVFSANIVMCCDPFIFIGAFVFVEIDKEIAELAESLESEKGPVTAASVG
jgi:Na+/glutamate symporter